MISAVACARAFRRFFFVNCLPKGRLLLLNLQGIAGAGREVAPESRIGSLCQCFGSRRRGGRWTTIRWFRTRPPAHRFTIYEPPWERLVADSCDSLKEQRLGGPLSW